MYIIDSTLSSECQTFKYKEDLLIYCKVILLLNNT